MKRKPCRECGASQPHEPCEDCGKVVHIGDWPFCPHGKPTKAHGFEPYYDYALGKMITGWGDVRKELRPKWEDDHIVKLEHRDKPESYYRELNERRRAREAGRL